MVIYLETDTGQPRARRQTVLASANRLAFGLVTPLKQQPEVWVVEGDAAFRLGDSRIHNPYFAQIEHGEDVVASIRRRVSPMAPDPDIAIEPMNLPPGRYFPRMARPRFERPGSFPEPFDHRREFEYERSTATLHAISVVERLRACFQVVDPNSENMNVYGVEFRNIIILAATEAEAQFKGILRANNYASLRRNWTISDYEKLEAAMRLSDFSLALEQYPWLDTFFPFEAWGTTAPATRLPWYAAYNALKHDRENTFAQATLRSALEAVGALVVLGAAQFGIHFIRDAPELSRMFRFEHRPEWSIGDTHGRAPGQEMNGEPIDYPFV